MNDETTSDRDDLHGGVEIRALSADPPGVDGFAPPSSSAPGPRSAGALGEAMTGPRAALEGPDARALLAAAAAGDTAAFRRVYRENVDRVHRTVQRILGPSDGDVDDVVQQTFLAALEAARKDGFDGRSKLSTFLLGIASRRALDAARERQRRARWSRIPVIGALLPAPKAQPSDVEDRGFAAWALGHLSPEQRQAFVLHAVEGHTLQEIADMTGIGVSTLHARVQAARKKLDALLVPHGEEMTR